ncbi:TonB-dependent receptor plug domain-containing protein [Vulcaniibacterium thermophilum]|jgi:iron complex outermembrane recepter protein|uniref:TonB-dependent receptor n=1 Tax=Vulcaniibacterium thermophilum TaxID=1169913 RepID=A0A918Z0U8_9GAMM|nr:TonB-dependent receptor [Vulcaniibacterium thermophilum]GHE31559.1 TonB-dependent receptor [Vulcaniibacterium thermophilum]
MTYKTSKLRDAITFALAVGATTVAGTGLALAQEAQEDPATLDRVEVTGSRIKRVDTETSQPILSLDRQAIESTGVTSVGDVLQQISTSGAALNTTFNNGGNGQTQIDLRNLGSNRTLVLVNGRRWVTGLGGAVDLNTIPIAAVERIEVLKDGASAIYGSDAIAGVVNIITRQNFEGASASAFIGTTNEGDGTQQAYDFIVGGGSDRFNAMLGANYVKQEPVFAGDREISAVPAFGLPGTNVLAGASSTSRFGRFDYPTQGPGQFTLIPGAAGCPNNQVCDPSVVSQFRAFSITSDGFNFAPENYLSTPQERIGIFGQARFDLTDSIAVKAEVMYNERRSEQYLAPQPLSFGETLPPGFNAPTSLSYTFNLSADSIYNPFGVDITRVQIRMPSFAPRRFHQDVDTFRFAGAIEGSFELGEKYFAWDVGTSYTDNNETDVTYGLQNLARVRDAVGPSMIVNGVPVCVRTPGDPTTIIEGCVPLNVMGNAEDMTREMVNYINYVDHATIYDEQKSYFANLSGEIAELPGGMLAFATGYEHREVNGSFNPDALASSGLTSGSQSTSTAGGYTVDEFFAELSIPLLKDVAGADLLEFSVAARYSDYSTFGDTMNPKFGFKWKPFEDLLVRGNWSKGFRAPSINELFAGTADNFPTLYDPCDAINLYAAAATGQLSSAALAAVTANCVADGVPANYSQPNPQIRTTVGGNPNLQPETSTSRTLGLVWSPGFAPGLSMSLDWWKIEIEDPIQAIGIQQAIDDCYLALPTERDAFACSLITRDPTTGDVADVNATLTNQGSADIEGYDFTVDYTFETGFGKFSVNWDNAYISKYETRISDASAPVSRVGNYSTNFPVWRLRSNLSVNWERGDWDASLKGRWYSALDEDCSGVAVVALYTQTPEFENLCSDPNVPSEDFTGSPVRRIENTLEATMYWDAQVGVKLPWNARVALGVNNLFDEDPPVSYQAFANSFDPQYELPGQFYYLRYDQKF